MQRTNEDRLRENLKSEERRTKFFEEHYYEGVGNIPLLEQIVVIRRPVLMEDEGNFHPLFVGKDWKSVNEFIREFTDDGYFSPSCLLYTGGLSGRSGTNEFKIQCLRDYLNKDK
jgi:hypothetical protein